MWARYTDAELVESSDQIITGELIGQTRIKMPGQDFELTVGIIRIESVLKGDRGQGVILLVLPGFSNKPISSSNIIYRDGQRGLWFLRLHQPGAVGLYQADHPQRFVTMNKAAAPITMVKRMLQP
ncbi:MAG: hypothetical protein GY696_12605 [Gammaproteobacteria bacterium]|nr:hypothetical protein [Gammaproteobacteria bacterium]